MARRGSRPTWPTSRSRARDRPLEELRLRRRELAIDAELAAGRHGELVGELEALVVEHPYRERLRAQLMLALYRSRPAGGRAAGLPGRAQGADRGFGYRASQDLRDLERAILAQDPVLRPPALVPCVRRPAERAAGAADAHRSGATGTATPGARCSAETMFAL